MGCYKCKNNSSNKTTVMCEGCSRSVHLSCELIDDIPEEDWYCKDCEENEYYIKNIPWVKGNICHYCRRTNVKSLQCENSNCKSFFCIDCLTDNFPCSRDYASAFPNNDKKWLCLKCRKSCYCNLCIESYLENWKKDEISLDIPRNGKEYLIKWKGKSYNKCTWVKQSFFIDNDLIKLFNTFYVKYVRNNYIPNTEYLSNYRKIEKIIRKSQKSYDGSAIYDKYLVYNRYYR